ncbi:MAG: M56 family metallopeptidase [Gemmatimonadota bacterium]
MGAVEVLNAFGGWLVPTLARLSLELAILAAVVAAAVFAFRVRSPRWRHAFWGLVLAKPVATFLVASPLSLYWFLQPVPPAPADELAGPRPSRRSFSSRPATAPRPDARLPVMAPRPARPMSPWQRLDRHGLAAGTWVAAASLRALRLAEVLLFFHPAVWWCGRAMGREAEVACDEAVLRAHAGRRAEYAQGLVEVAALAGVGERPATDGLLMNTFAARETGFSRRVQRVLDGRGRAMPTGLAVAGILAFAAVAVV